MENVLIYRGKGGSYVGSRAATEASEYWSSKGVDSARSQIGEERVCGADPEVPGLPSQDGEIICKWVKS
jgi:hypothetical protein